MNKENSQFEFLDVITIISFAIQLQNQTKIFDMNDVQADNNRIARDIHQHLEEQDKKIDKIMEMMKNDNSRNIQ